MLERKSTLRQVTQVTGKRPQKVKRGMKAANCRRVNPARGAQQDPLPTEAALLWIILSEAVTIAKG
jgi:hypothetical protein